MVVPTPTMSREQVGSPHGRSPAPRDFLIGSNWMGTGELKQKKMAPPPPKSAHFTGVGELKKLSEAKRTAELRASLTPEPSSSSAHQPSTYQPPHMILQSQGMPGAWDSVPKPPPRADTSSPQGRSVAGPTYARDHQQALLQKQLVLPRMSALPLEDDLPEWYQDVGAQRRAFDRFGLRRRLDNVQVEARHYPLLTYEQIQAKIPPPGSQYSGSFRDRKGERSKLGSSHSKSRLGSPPSRGVSSQGSRLNKSSASARTDRAMKKELEDAVRTFEERHRDTFDPMGGSFKRDSSKSQSFAVDSRPTSAKAQPFSALNASVTNEYLVESTPMPPYAVETEFTSEQEAQAESMSCSLSIPEDLPYNEEERKEANFAWWSRHWAQRISTRHNEVSKPKPISPVEKIWLGNFQKRPVPWRKEQLGAFPSYKDFPWPPPPDLEGNNAKIDHLMRQTIPFALDRERFTGPNEPSVNYLMRDSHQYPDFMDKLADLTGDYTTKPGGVAQRPHSVVGWKGYKQQNPDEKYDPLCRRAYTDTVERLLTIIANKLEEHSVSNFYLAFAYFDHDKSGFIDKSELNSFLGAYNINLTKEEVDEVVMAFEDDEDGKISYGEFVYAIETQGRAHPLKYKPKPVKPYHLAKHRMIIPGTGSSQGVGPQNSQDSSKSAQHSALSTQPSALSTQQSSKSSASVRPNVRSPA